MISEIQIDTRKAIKEPKTNFLKRALSAYAEYCDAHSNEKVYWFMKAILVIPCAMMVVSIISVSLVFDRIEYYIALAMLLFFSNIIVHIAECRSRIYIPVYHFSIIIMVLVSVIALTYKNLIIGF